MKTYKVKQITQSCVDSTICNCCGRKFDPIQDEVIEINHIFGYFAKNGYDGERHKSDICEECYFKWVDTFEHSPVD